MEKSARSAGSPPLSRLRTERARFPSIRLKQIMKAIRDVFVGDTSNELIEGYCKCPFLPVILGLYDGRVNLLRCIESLYIQDRYDFGFSIFSAMTLCGFWHLFSFSP